MEAPELDEARLRQLMAVGPWLIAELDLETVLDRFLATAMEVTRARYAACGVLDADRRQLERFVTRGLSKAEEHTIGPRPRGQGILGLLITDSRPLRLSDLRAHPRSYGFPGGHPPMRSFLGVPIIIAGEAWGNLYLTDKDGDQDFDEGDELAAVTLAAWAAIAIEHARLMAAANERQARLARALKGLEATRAIAIAVGAETDLAAVLELIAKRGRAIVGARSVLMLLQQENDLVLALTAGHTEAQPGLRIPIHGSTSGEVMLSQRPRRLENVAALKISADSLGVPNARSALMVPLVYRHRALGVLAAFDREEDVTFTEEDEQVLVAFAASAATAVATAQTVQADRLRATLAAAEAERKHWARELHDETLQALGGLKLIASAARRAVDAEGMRTALDGLVSGLENEIENLHAIISELRPAALDDLGLRPAIQALAHKQEVATGIEVDCRLSLPDPAIDEVRLAPELETTVYRLIQEALSNVVKHSGAQQVSIAVATNDTSVSVEVRDSGHGFPADRSTAGYGLTGMRERVVLSGGSLEIGSGANGTTVTASLPLRYAEKERGAGELELAG